MPADHEAGAARLALAQTTLGVLALATLIGASLWVLRPFIGPTIWAAMVVIASWPLMRRVQVLVGGRRWLATLVMTLALLLLFVVPLVVAIGTIVGNADLIVGWAKLAASYRMAEPPAWLTALPLVGTLAADLWRQLVDAGADGLLQRLSPYAGNLTRWFVNEVGSLGFLILQFMLTAGVAAVMYHDGEVWAHNVLRIGERLGGERGRHLVELASDAVRGVALGVGGTALVQSVLGGIALKITGVPLAGLLTAVMLMLCLAQIGPLPVLLAAVGWLFWQGDTSWAIVLLAASAVVGTIDNVIRPVLIRLGADLPILLILAGVVGGLFAFGLVGIFVGPVVLAVAWTLLAAWVGDADPLALDAVPQQLEPGEQHADLEQAIEQPGRDDAHRTHAEPDADRGQRQQDG